jgi:hypothetical protein
LEPFAAADVLGHMVLHLQTESLFVSESSPLSPLTPSETRSWARCVDQVTTQIFRCCIHLIMRSEKRDKKEKSSRYRIGRDDQGHGHCNNRNRVYA